MDLALIDELKACLSPVSIAFGCVFLSPFLKCSLIDENTLIHKEK